MVTHPPSLFYTVSAQHRLNTIFFSSHPYSNFGDAECQKWKNHKFWHCPIANLWRYRDKIKHNMGMESGTTIILVSTDSALIRQYKFTSLKKCKLNFTYRGKFPWEKRGQIYRKSLMVNSIKANQTLEWKEIQPWFWYLQIQH